MSSDVRFGFFAGLGAYLIWGFLPVYFKLVDLIPAMDVLGHRILWSVPMGFALILIAGRFREFTALLKSRDALWILLSAVLIGLNWLTYIWAINQQRILEASLGYYLNPLANIAVASIFLSERLRKWQWVAVFIASVAVLMETIALGRLPWVSLVLCFSFCFYGLIRRNVKTDSRVGFTLEVLFLLPAVLIWFAVTAQGDHGGFGTDLGDTLILILAGPVTAIPLMLFALGAKRLRFSTIGIMQYLAPSLQLVCAIAYGEELTPKRLITFSLIWCALLIFSVDAFGNERRSRRATVRPA